MTKRRLGIGCVGAGMVMVAGIWGGPASEGQDRLKTMPGDARYESVRKNATRGFEVRGRDRHLEATKGRRSSSAATASSLRFEVATKQIADAPSTPGGDGGGRGMGGVPGRPDSAAGGWSGGGRPTSALSPDKTLEGDLSRPEPLRVRP